MLHVHGPGGVGKTTLLRRWASEAEHAGRAAVALDGRRLEVPPSGFLAALAVAREASDGERALASLPPDPVLLIDTYRRHLTTGLERVVERLWERELSS